MNYYKNYDNNSYDWSNNFDNDYNSEKHNSKKHMCCVRRVQETICCYPSYYDEKDNDKNNNCFEKDDKHCYHEKEDKKQDNWCRNQNRNFGCCGFFRNFRC